MYSIRLANPLRMSLQTISYFSMNSRIPPNTNFWSKVFGKYLLVTNTVGSGIFLPFGDALAQQYERLGEMNKAFDYSRSGSMMITGLVIGPVQHGFYLLLDKLLSGNKLWDVLRKILADQLIMSPIYIVMFFHISSLLEGKSITECNAELYEKFLYTWFLDCCLWPGLQYLNFRYFKTLYRVVFINVANCVYIVLLSHIKHGFQ
ncbi:mpv17-like protein 2 [Drosophila elegans]|uniref:mpv17-like protein 2 n=1 Tax=Drosophila elegans TaxID=30023 RepID=UPI0007E7A35E|nr:mpv17-like protein 2 [Drosophila elegans]XP_017127942.1 mpv17-like protein 2 [Drosophila elegans]